LPWIIRDVPFFNRGKDIYAFASFCHDFLGDRTCFVQSWGLSALILMSVGRINS
jgi:hypothetical protein